MSEWNPKEYLMFKNQRTQPAIDLVNRILIDKPEKILDIGCGPGNSTEILFNKFKGSYILGIDSSLNMINTAKESYPKLNFTLCDASTNLSSLDTDFDIVFSNACIQWLPNHNILLKNMISLLKNGGILAIQIPMNYDEPIHKIIKEVSNNNKWSLKFNNPRKLTILTEEEYFNFLSDISKNFTIWKTTYCHRMTSHQDILNWCSSTGLRPYLDQLSSDNQQEFKNDILNRIVDEYPVQKNGEIIFRFPRFFMLATA